MFKWFNQFARKAAPMPATNEDIPKKELIFALVGAVGTDLQHIQNLLKDALKEVGYSTVVDVTLSALMKNLEIYDEKGQGIQLVDSPQEQRISSYMDAGDALRTTLKQGDAVALLAINQIIEERKKNVGQEKIAYILRSLKHPDEVHTLRRVYGESFFLIGVYTEDDTCRNSLAKLIADSHGTAAVEGFLSIADDLIRRDAEEPGDYGQRVRDTYHLADVFIALDALDKVKEKAKKDVKRFVGLLFGNTFHTPTKDEYLMFSAHAVSARSASLGRQVGSVIANENGEVLSVGVNDVPCFGGGLYWEDSPKDMRDHALKYDSNNREINNIVNEIVSSLQEKKLLNRDVDMELIKAVVQRSKVKTITEYGRMVHSEMDAIVQAARLGISIRGAFLYTTLFPCHNCAKHIVAAGIKRVIYIEPYSKSLAGKLHTDSIVMDDEEVEDRVVFKSFVGIGPRRYLDLFLLVTSAGELKRKDDAGDVLEWKPENAKPRLGFFSQESYFVREKIALEKLESKIK